MFPYSSCFLLLVVVTALLGWDELPQGFDLRQMTLEQNGTLYVYARSDNAPVVVELQVDQDTIYYSLPIVNRVAFVFSFACCWCRFYIFCSTG